MELINVKTKWQRPLNIFLIVLGLFIFFFSIELFSGSMKLFGKSLAETLFNFIHNPLIGVFIGILATTLIQSSSATTSLTVGLVATGALQIDMAIPIIMGANIGTTVTNSIVSYFHIGRKQEFSRAFPSAVVHDMFNVLSVLVLFPIEILFHPIKHASGFLTSILGGTGGIKFVSPIKLVIKPIVHTTIHITGGKPWITIIIAIILLYTGLKIMVDNLKKTVGQKMEIWLDKYLFGAAWKAFLIGIALTALIQSSSITTSLIVPIVAAGFLTVEKIYPYTLGANIGTTLTAILAALVTGSFPALQTAFAHLFFNIFGIIIWFPLKIVPISLAKKLGKWASKHRIISIVYVVGLFIIIPLLFILLLRR